jgi:hypothetical protein
VEGEGLAFVGLQEERGGEVSKENGTVVEVGMVVVGVPQ